MLKFANFQVIEAKVARMGHGLVKDSHRHAFEYDPQPGFLYVRSRAISSRCNDNFDEFPAEEIAAAYRTFVGKPVFINHHNANHRRARGVIVDAVLHEDTNPDGSPDTWVEVLMEVDAINFPILAEKIVKGEIDRTSMGCDVAYSKCSYCGNKAVSPVEYCDHIRRHKGRRIRRRTASGDGMEDVLVREVCYGLRFFENSLLVEDPADPTAFFLGVESGDDLVAAGRKTADRKTRTPEWDAEDEELHPRDQGGKFTDSGNSGPTRVPDGTKDTAPTQEKPVEAEPTTHGPTEAPTAVEAPEAPTTQGGDPHVYEDEDGTWHPHPETKGTGTAEDPVVTPSIEDAAKALSLGLHVELNRPPEVATLLDRLAQMIQQAKDSGAQLQIDLCNVTVRGTNLFCTESKGIPRSLMPQLKSLPQGLDPNGRAMAEVQPNADGEYDIQPHFLQHLKDLGYTAEEVDYPAAYLKATQNQLNAGKVAGITDAILNKGVNVNREPIFVSDDDYIVDGHHRWAASVSADWSDGDVGDVTMPVWKIKGLDIITLLDLSNKFAADWGFKQQGVEANNAAHVPGVKAASKGCAGCGPTLGEMNAHAARKAAARQTPIQEMALEAAESAMAAVTASMQVCARCVKAYNKGAGHGCHAGPLQCRCAALDHDEDRVFARTAAGTYGTLWQTSTGYVHRSRACPHINSWNSWPVPAEDVLEDGVVKAKGVKACTRCFPSAPTRRAPFPLRAAADLTVAWPVTEDPCRACNGSGEQGNGYECYLCDGSGMGAVECASRLRGMTNDNPENGLPVGRDLARAAAVETPCQTPGTQFSTHINGDEIAADVDLPFDLDLTERDAEVLEANIHNALELVLAPYFRTAKDDRFKGVSLKQDDDGWYVTTHRARSKSYPTPEDIPQDKVDFIESTGALQAVAYQYPDGRKLDAAELGRIAVEEGILTPEQAGAIRGSGKHAYTDLEKVLRSHLWSMWAKGLIDIGPFHDYEGPDDTWAAAEERSKDAPMALAASLPKLARGPLDTPITTYGLRYDRTVASQPVVEQAASWDGWDRLAIHEVPVSDLWATEPTVSSQSIDKVVSGAEAFRPGYAAYVLYDAQGRALIIDGNHRAAMYAALGHTTMPAHVATLSHITTRASASPTPTQRRAKARARRAVTPSARLSSRDACPYAHQAKIDRATDLLDRLDELPPRKQEHMRSVWGGALINLRKEQEVCRWCQEEPVVVASLSDAIALRRLQAGYGIGWDGTLSDHERAFHEHTGIPAWMADAMHDDVPPDVRYRPMPPGFDPTEGQSLQGMEGDVQVWTNAMEDGVEYLLYPDGTCRARITTRNLDRPPYDRWSHYRTAALPKTREEAEALMATIPAEHRDGFMKLWEAEHARATHRHDGRYFHASPADLAPGTILRPGGGPVTDPDFYDSQRALDRAMGDPARESLVWISPDEDDVRFWAATIGATHVYEVEPTNPRPWRSGIDGWVCDSARIIRKVDHLGSKTAFHKVAVRPIRIDGEEHQVFLCRQAGPDGEMREWLTIEGPHGYAVARGATRAELVADFRSRKQKGAGVLEWTGDPSIDRSLWWQDGPDGEPHLQIVLDNNQGAWWYEVYRVDADLAQRLVADGGPFPTVDEAERVSRAKARAYGTEERPVTVAAALMVRTPAPGA